MHGDAVKVNDPEYYRRLSICARCPSHNGQGECTTDKRDIRLQCADGTCPLRKFDGALRQYLHGFIGIGKAITPGVDRADAKTIAGRRVICRACPESKPTLIGTLGCEKCGCQLWAKTKLASEHCPLQKW